MCIYFILLLVSEQTSGNEKTINKSASQPFLGASQPHNRLGWNADVSGQTKVKEDEVRKETLVLSVFS